MLDTLFAAATMHSIFLSVCAGGLATDLTLYLLVGIDFLINMYFTIKVFRIKRNFTKKKQEDLLMSVQVLVLGEVLEIILPLAFLVCFLAAYHGPNAELLGNIKNDFWQSKAVDEAWGPTKNLLFLVAFDCLSLTLAASFLLYFCNINLGHVFLHLMKEFGLIFSVQHAYQLEHLFCVLAVACGMDLTFQFDWILDQERWQEVMAAANMTTN